MLIWDDRSIPPAIRRSRWHGDEMETRVWSAVDLAIPWGLWAIRLGLDGAETQADRGPLGCVLRDRAIRATGRDPETETW
uniref:Uncharacterized protein n=1 Tax=Peronospora matthiolae TaxID=2874970 RepID=A0AAV1UBM5_9STRA